MKKFAHSLVLVVFAIGCLCIWGVLSLLAGFARHGYSFPGFTALLISLRPVLVALPIIAVTYCLWVWFQKADRVPSWIGFFATTMGVLVLVALPAMVAAYLPFLTVLNQVAVK
jgi:predicted membrane-bound mannosyltransferase